MPYLVYSIMFVLWCCVGWGMFSSFFYFLFFTFFFCDWGGWGVGVGVARNKVLINNSVPVF